MSALKIRCDYHHLRKLGHWDNASRWYPRAEIQYYFRGIRAPSYRFPKSFERAALTLKFAAWLVENHPEIAREIGLI